ncbi:lytic transglycosylase domain-containing protein [Oceanirhabdus sp. W0125-5]|uniref:lytic transglycosylase domain-containing protein n=1 Tax=Oceanirhabdus sp. W0125-5 TaxID=2999116 RepID=UPI0022F2AB8C|nr:lytic transglycosylase domain-containing protein [Oceanirhabdus sp. W0125-5]WBW95880.1 lytic transglycosylase domain-containing protein [Oceanirhabdus sp. W0125-5]
MKKGKVIFLLLLFSLIAIVVFHKEILSIYYPIKFQSYVETFSKENNLDKYMVYSMIKNESNFDEKAESNRGAKGLMQIMPSTAEWIESIKNFGYSNESQLFNAKLNIRMGCWYISNLLEEFHDTEKAVAAYNAGRGNVAKWLSNDEFSRDNKLIFIPFKETDVYLKRVMFGYKMYKYIYGD